MQGIVNYLSFLVKNGIYSRGSKLKDFHNSFTLNLC